MDLRSKLQLRPDQAVRVVDGPDGFRIDPAGRTSGDGPDPGLLVFVTDRAGLEVAGTELAASAAADRLTWVAYPKAGQLGTDLNRDSLAAFLRARGVRPVRQVSVDQVWSALRFRPG